MILDACTHPRKPSLAGFTIITPVRTWYMMVPESESADAWVSALGGGDAKVDQMLEAAENMLVPSTEYVRPSRAPQCGRRLITLDYRKHTIRAWFSGWRRLFQKTDGALASMTWQALQQAPHVQPPKISMTPRILDSIDPVLIRTECSSPIRPSTLYCGSDDILGRIHQLLCAR